MCVRVCVTVPKVLLKCSNTLVSGNLVFHSVISLSCHVFQITLPTVRKPPSQRVRHIYNTRSTFAGPRSHPPHTHTGTWLFQRYRCFFLPPWCCESKKASVCLFSPPLSISQFSFWSFIRMINLCIIHSVHSTFPYMMRPSLMSGKPQSSHFGGQGMRYCGLAGLLSDCRHFQPWSLENCSTLRASAYKYLPESLVCQSSDLFQADIIKKQEHISSARVSSGFFHPECVIAFIII